jgi:adenylate cyclase
VNIAARMESHGEAGRVALSENTYHHVKDHFECEHRGAIEAKNKGLMNMYFLNPNSPV